MSGRLPLGSRTESQLNVLFHDQSRYVDGKPMAQKNAGISLKGQLNTPSTSPCTESFTSKVLGNVPTSAWNRSGNVYGTPPSVLVEADQSQHALKPKYEMTETQILRLKLRVRLAYYKYKTNQVHLKFSDILKSNPSKKHHFAANPKKGKKLRKLAGSVTSMSSAASPASKAMRAISSSSQCITPEKRTLADGQASTSSVSSGNTPMSVKAAKSLIHMFSTGA